MFLTRVICKMRHFYVIGDLAAATATALHAAAFQACVLVGLGTSDLAALQVCMATLAVCLVGLTVSRLESVASHNRRLVEALLLATGISDAVLYFLMQRRQLAVLLSWLGSTFILANAVSTLWQSVCALTTSAVWMWFWGSYIAERNLPLQLLDASAEILLPPLFLLGALNSMRIYEVSLDVLLRP